MLTQHQNVVLPLNIQVCKAFDKYKNDGFTILGVPTNDFNQEFSKDSDVKEFCEIRYGVNFPLTSIQKSGRPSSPIYKWIASEVSVIGQPRWNFHKFLIGKDGNIINWFSSMTSPSSSGLMTEVEDAIFN